MAGQEVSLSLAHRCMRHASAEFMGLHKCKADTTPQAKLTPEDRVTLFMDNSFARYCAFNHLQNGDIVQVSVPSVWREAVTIIGGDEDEPIFVEGIEVINSPKPSGKTYFVAQSSRWVTADVAKKAKRLVFAQTYLVRFSTQNGYKAELLLDNNDWLNSEKVRQACLKLAELYDDEINLHTAEPEFDEFAWKDIEEAPDLVWKVKKDVYTKMVKEFKPIIDSFDANATRLTAQTRRV